MRLQLRISQDQETPLTTQVGERFSYRYAYARSADSIAAGAPGQDYLAIDSDDARLVFVLCDGVSQSFFGDLAARFLGDELARWLGEQSEALLHRPNEVQAAAAAFLNALTETAGRQVAEFVLPENLAPMLATVLEKKRALGSEAIFTAGFLDLAAGQGLLCWMGDARLRVWAGSGEISDQTLGKHTFLTQERWSTRRGLVGELHTAWLSLANVQRVVTYSDGLARLDQQLAGGSPSNRTIANIIEDNQHLPTSDDISFLEIWLGKRPSGKVRQPKPPARLKVDVDDETRQLRAHWQPVEKATGYEVAAQTTRGWRLYPAVEPGWVISLDQLPPAVEYIAVRTWVRENASEWCKPYPVKQTTGYQSGTVAEGPSELHQLHAEPGASANLVNLRDLAGRNRNKRRLSYRFILLFTVLLAAILAGSFLVNQRLNSGQGSDAPVNLPHVETLAPIPTLATPTTIPDAKGEVLEQKLAH